MAEGGVLVNDSFRPGFDVSGTISKGSTVKLNSSGEAVTGDDDASSIVGFALTDGDASGDNLDQVLTVVPAVKGYVANVLVAKSDATGATDVAIGDELFYSADGDLMKEAGSSTAVSSEVAAIALEANTSTTASLTKVYIIGGV